MVGFIDKNGHPYFKVKVYGVSDKLAKEYDAMLDTGFSGFLSLPLSAAIPLGLILKGTANFTLADGSIEETITCIGFIKINGEVKRGLIVISKGMDILLGMEFLRISGKKLTIDCQNGIIALD